MLLILLRHFFILTGQKSEIIFLT